MINTNKEWNQLFKELKSLMSKPDGNLVRIRELSILLHGYTHETLTSENNNIQSLEDRFWHANGNYRRFSQSKPYSAAWHIWHSTRIEDITCSHFLLNENEVLDTNEFYRKINVPFRHTGNSMDFHDMEILNLNVNLDELRQYRIEVQKKTQQVFKQLTAEKLMGKVLQISLQEIFKIGSIAKDDSWLLEYWGKKRISGIIQMPLTRHLLVHLNSAMRMI